MRPQSMRIPLICFLLLVGTLSRSQNYVLSGFISDKKEALPFATILGKNTTLGTNSNINGQYALKLPAGSYEIVYQYVGYSKRTETVQLQSDKNLDVNLSADGISLQEVVVKAGEDPAYPIIRKAIKKRSFYLNQIDAYTCKAYIKGLQRINHIPKNLEKLIKLGGGNSSDTSDLKGVVYLSESESKYHFRKKDDEKEIMFSSKVSGDNKAFSFNQLSDMKVNFYNNLVDMGNLSDRPFTSPINDNAFLFYKFYLLGTLETEGKNIYKIKVVPKRKTDPCFRGIIYIQDSTYRITSVDLMLTKDAKIDFVDTLSIKQLHAPVAGDSVWLPVTLHFGFDFKAFGFKGNGYFNANIKDYDLNPVFPKKFFKNEVLKVEDGANKKDSVYWTNNRAVPLTYEEEKDYREKDSIARIRGTDQYKDSVDKVNNKFRITALFVGYNYSNTRKQFSLSLPGIITDAVQYNTVEGLNLSYKFNLNKSFKDYRFLSIAGKSRYGFANKLWGGDLGFQYLYKPEKFSRFGLRLKSIVEQYNQAEPISQAVNTSYSLFLNQNFMKLFKESAGEIFYHTEIINGIYLNTQVKYAERAPLKNMSDILFIDDKNLLFTSNDPLYPNTHDSLFQTNNALTIELSASFRFKQKYYTMPHQKIISGSKYPRLSIHYKKALPVLNAVADYDLLSAVISDNVNLGLLGRFNLRIKGGTFLNTKKMFFVDYKHFLTNQTVIGNNENLSTFRLLPYYSYSTKHWFGEAHGEQHFNGFIINKIPLLKQLKLKEVVGAHFLSTKELKSYYEINFGFEKIFKVIRIDYVLGYLPNQQIMKGYMLGLKLDF
jgi:hypothetical protein